MHFEYNPCSFADVETIQHEYVQALAAPVDTYLDTFVFASQIYTIAVEGDLAGFFAIHETHLLTQFYVKEEHAPRASELFQDVLRRKTVTAALVPTCDKLFYDVALDEFSRIEKLGYFFQDVNKKSNVADVSEFGTFQQAMPADIATIVKVSGTFFDDLERRVQDQEIFVLHGRGRLLGVGIIEKSRLLPGYVSVGMFVNPNNRRTGIGATIIVRLKTWCYEHNFIPIAGCAYENIGSKRTLEKAGFKSQSQLLKIHF